MKFLKHHHAQIMELFEQKGVALEELNFVKRKGRIRLEYKDFTFSYLRTKKTAIDETSHQWVQSEFYRVKLNNEAEQVADDWPATLALIEAWMERF